MRLPWRPRRWHSRSVPLPLVVVLLVLLLTGRVLAQGSGLWIRPVCTTLTGPIAGETWCFDSTAHALRVWNGTLYASSNIFATIGLTNLTNQIVMGTVGVASGTQTMAALAGDRIWTWPDVTGTVFLANGGQTVTSGTWNGSAVNTQYGGTGGNFSATAQGSLWYFSAAGTVSALAPGVAGRVLTTQGAGADPTWTAASGAAQIVYYLLPVSAAFPTTNFPQLVKNSGTNWTDYTLDYDQVTSECAFWYFNVASGTTVNNGGIEIASRQATLTTGNVGWLVTTSTRADGEAWDTAGTTNTVAAETVKGTTGQVLVQSKTLTATGWAANEVLQVQICRNVAVDTVAEDAKFIVGTVRIN